MIRHATLQSAATVGALAVAMIQPPFGALLMSPVGCPMLPATSMAAAFDRAVPLPAITA